MWHKVIFNIINVNKFVIKAIKIIFTLLIQIFIIIKALIDISIYLLKPKHKSLIISKNFLPHNKKVFCMKQAFHIGMQ